MSGAPIRYRPVTDRWLGVPSSDAGFSERERAAWALTLEEMLIARGADAQAARETVLNPSLQTPPAGETSRLWYVPLGGGQLGVSEISVSDIPDNWVEGFDERIKHPAHLVRDPEVKEYESESFEQAREGIRYQEDNEGRILGIHVLAGIKQGHLVIMRSQAFQMTAFASMMEDSRVIFESIEVV